MRTSFVASVLSFLTACSMSMPQAHTIETTTRPCTTSTSAPAADAALALAGGFALLLGLATVISDGPGESGDRIDVEGIGTVAGLAGGIVMTTAGLSARHGNRSVRACEQRTMWGPHGPPPGI